MSGESNVANESDKPTDIADDLRLRGNHEFSQGRYDAALSLYTAALEQLTAPPLSATSSISIRSSGDTPEKQQQLKIILLCNRSATFFQQEEYELAEKDAAESWTLSKETSVKAAFRLAKVQMKLQKFDEAKTSIQKALRVLDANSTHTHTSSSDTHARCEAKDAERKALQDLWNQVISAALEHEGNKAKAPEKTIRYAQRAVSIKEFEKGRRLGYGNFSEIIVVKHKVTGEEFALKMITKKEAADLAKRQHPNVYNEIQMERRVLLERLTPHPNIIRMFHAFQDYNTLYYLMDLHVEWSDLWNEVQWIVQEDDGFGETKRVKHMVGCHRSQAIRWMFQMIDALEHLHRHGIVHRDIKTENVMLNKRGHVVLLDFGTAKDLIQTDLNGPEFVGTPDFMSPEAVNGTSGMREAKEAADRGEIGATHAADLWAFGAMIYLTQTGRTPFWSPSQYLTFLKIKRGNLTRPVGIVDDDAWDLIQKLMNMDPAKRLGAKVFQLVFENPNKQTGRRHIAPIEPGGYDIIRNHPYFASCHGIETQIREETPIPSLRDLCVRPVASLAYEDAMDMNLCEQHPPGDGSRHDMTRLDPRDRAAVLHVLDRRKLLRDEPRLYARFFTDTVASRLDKIRPETRDFVGLTQMNDDGGKAPNAIMNDPHSAPPDVPDIEIVHLTNPLLSKEKNINCDDDTRKQWVKLFKKCIANINRTRPKLVVVSGFVDEKSRKLLSRVSDSIPVVVNDGSAFFTFWLLGVQCIALQSNDLSEESAQMSWLREQLEQCRLSKHPLFCFVDCDPRSLPSRVIKRLARGRTLSLFGLTNDNSFSTKISYTANETVPANGSQHDGAGNDDDDGFSINSDTSSENEKDNFTMMIEGTIKNGLRWITVDPEPDLWSAKFKPISFDAK